MKGESSRKTFHNLPLAEGLFGWNLSCMEPAGKEAVKTVLIDQVQLSDVLQQVTVGWPYLHWHPAHTWEKPIRLSGENVSLYGLDGLYWVAETCRRSPDNHVFLGLQCQQRVVCSAWNRPGLSWLGLSWLILSWSLLNPMKHLWSLRKFWGQ